MCTIVVIHRLHPELGTVVAANRDEFYGRPARAPAVVREAPRVVAGVDLEKGGTWMGATGDGAFVALTNQRTWLGADPALRSRGEITMGMLAQGGAEAMHRWLTAFDASAYNAFNVIFGDAERVYVAYGRPDRSAVEVRPLGAGVHVLVNDRMGSPEFPKADRARALVEPHVRAPWEGLRAALARMLADHRTPAPEALPDPPAGADWPKALLARLQAICTHTEAYGTRSAAILALAPERVAHYLHAEGPPCTAPFEAVTPLFRD
ncbi:MAG: NRDE family protein [Myxococcota bacterium]